MPFFPAPTWSLPSPGLASPSALGGGLLPTLLLYGAALFVASLSGGVIPMLLRLTHRRMQISLSFVAGVMLGIGLLHMLPHGIQALGEVDLAVRWTLFGFLGMFFLQRLFHFHHHEAPAADAKSHEHDDKPHEHSAHKHAQHEHGVHHGPAAHKHEAMAQHRFTMGGAAIGLALHSLMDGVALAAATATENAETGAYFAGLGVFLAVVLHKPFDSLTIGALMAAGGWSRFSRHWVNAIYALVAPCGMLVFYLGARGLGDEQALLGRALAFAAGAFLCIAASDLLPELQFHSHDRLTLSASLILGVVLAWAIILLESHGHDHHTAGKEHSPPHHNHQPHVDIESDHDQHHHHQP